MTSKKVASNAAKSVRKAKTKAERSALMSAIAQARPMKCRVTKRARRRTTRHR
jgi:hypothetical protein